MSFESPKPNLEGDKPLILLSNDDGVHAAGVQALRRELLAFADVVTVAPLYEQSAHSHALTLARPLRHRSIEPDVHAIDGTPADCIYVALFHRQFLPRRPDLVLSGVNHGYNLSTDTFYSGTVAAAREGALRGVPSIAFSLGLDGGLDLDLIDRAAQKAAELARRFAAAPHAEGVTPLLNVNFPAGQLEYRGVRATCLGKRIYQDDVLVRKDPRGSEYFWIGGPSARHDPYDGSDTDAVDAGFVSVTPLRLDVTLFDQLPLAAFVAGEGELPYTTRSAEKSKREER